MGAPARAHLRARAEPGRMRVPVRAQLAAAEERLAALSTRAASTVERASVAGLRVDLYTTLDRSSRAIAVGLDYLRHLGIDWSPHPTEEEARREYERVWSQLGGRAIEALSELPLMSDPAVPRDSGRSNQDGGTCVLYGSEPGRPDRLRGPSFLASSAATATLRAAIYVMLSMVAGPRFGDYRTDVYRFGRLGYDLVEGRGLTRFQARTYLEFAIWRSSLDETCPGRPRFGAPRVRGGEQDRRPHLRRLQLPAIEHEPSCGGRSAFRGGARSRARPRVRAEGAVRTCQ